MNKSRKMTLERNPRCEICKALTIYKGKSIGWKCTNEHCDSIELNKAK